MLNYNKLKNLALKFQNDNINGFSLAKQLNIETQTESETLKELGSKQSLLNGSPALLVNINRFVICYNPQTDYINYYVAHECSHYILKHNEDSLDNEMEANLLTCLILAPPKSLIDHNLYTADNISRMYNIPVDKANTYIDILFKKDKKYQLAYENHLIPIKKDKVPNKRYLILHLSIALAITAIMFFLVQGYRNNNDIVYQETETQTKILLDKTTSQLKTPIIEPVTESTTESVISEPAATQLYTKVKVTKSGKKYHLPDCRYVTYKTNTTELELEEALKIGYTPCSVCLPE